MPKNEPIPTEFKILLTTALNMPELEQGYWYRQYGAWSIEFSLNPTVGEQAELFNFQIIYQDDELCSFVKTEIDDEGFYICLRNLGEMPQLKRFTTLENVVNEVIAFWAIWDEYRKSLCSPR